MTVDSTRHGDSGERDRYAAGERSLSMIPVPTDVRAWLATGHSDIGKAFGSLALLVQETIKREPHVGDIRGLPRGTHCADLLSLPLLSATTATGCVPQCGSRVNLSAMISTSRRSSRPCQCGQLPARRGRRWRPGSSA